jgi:hypothetical protein
MKSLLDALQGGRLVELPAIDKEKSLHFLGTLIEAIPDFRTGLDFNAVVDAREKAANTSIGRGGHVAAGCGRGPFLRHRPFLGNRLRCGGRKPVRVLVITIPIHRAAYLREISRLARAIRATPALGDSPTFATSEMSTRLIDLLTAAAEQALPTEGG